MSQMWRTLVLLLATAVVCSSLKVETSPRSNSDVRNRPSTSVGRGNGWCGHEQEHHTLSTRNSVCQRSTCDDPEVMKAYVDAMAANPPPTLYMRYETNTIARSDGSEPHLSVDEFDSQDAVLNSAFAATGIEWTGTRRQWTDTDGVKFSNVVIDCDPSWLNDGVCDDRCNLAETGYDGGDCVDPNPDCDSTCTLQAVKDKTGGCTRVCVNFNGCAAKAGDGTCDEECNVRQASYDGGDCCGAGQFTCRDPDSPSRNYWNIPEMKEWFDRDTSDKLVITAVDGEPEFRLLGVATFPWYAEVFEVQGGVYMNTAQQAYGDFGSSSSMRGITLVHEIGHCLGLWHTHYGVSDIDDGGATCSLPCFEQQPDDPSDPSSATTGDLCPDTRPTPRNFACSDPDSSITDCSGDPYVNTPYTNYMGYAGDTCMTGFSPYQEARIRCYTESFYEAWLENPVPGHFSEPPLATFSSGEVIIEWAAPALTGGAVTYEVFRYDVDGDTTVSLGTVTALAFTDATPLSSSATYTVQGSNANGAGAVSLPSNMVAAPPPGYCDTAFQPLSSPRIISYPPSGSTGSSSVDTCWLVSVRSGSVVEVVFGRMDLGDDDTFYVYDGTDPSTANETIVDATTTSVTSTSSSIIVRYVSTTWAADEGFEFTFFENSDGCDTTTFISSPGYVVHPEPPATEYSVDEQVCWRIEMTTAVQLEFSRFATEAGYDFVTVHDGPFTTSPVLAGPFSGEALPVVTPSSSKFALVRFTSDGSITFPGFNFTFFNVEGPCSGGLFTPAVGEDVTFPLDGEYPNFADVCWLVTGTPGVPLQAEFTAFSTEKDFDVVDVHDGASVSAPLVSRMSGEYVAPFIPRPAQVTSSSMFIRFTSDYSFTSTGFSFSVVPASTAEICADGILIPETGADKPVRYPAGGGNYLNMMDTCWRAGIPEGMVASVTFTSYDTEENYDYVQVLSGTTGYTEVALVTGVGTGLTVPPVDGNEVLLRFISDESVTSSGFTFTIVFEPAGGTTAGGGTTGAGATTTTSNVQTTTGDSSSTTGSASSGERAYAVSSVMVLFFICTLLL